MLHLAQVQNNKNVGTVELRLLARKQSETSWAIINPEKNVPLTDTDSLNEGLLVLVDLCENHEVRSIKDAKDWVLEFVQQYLTIGVTPTFLKGEAERAEQWRHELTQQSQDLTRRHLEVEARREQIQVLEEELKREQQKMKEQRPNKTDSDETDGEDT